MRIRPMSDLHLEFNDFVPPTAASDVVVLAGDIDLVKRTNIPRWARETFPENEIVWVLGNHELYDFGAGIDACLDLARSQSHRSDVRLLEKEAAVIHGVRFVGCTLWTDFALYGTQEQSMAHARHGMTDFDGTISIRVSPDSPPTQFRPHHALDRHTRCVDWLNAELATPFTGKTVVVTHHAPHPRCQHPHYQGSALEAAYCSDLSWLIEKHQPALWVSGHSHASHDVTIGGTRLVSNQRGYSDMSELEDAPFDPALVIDA